MCNKSEVPKGTRKKKDYFHEISWKLKLMLYQATYVNIFLNPFLRGDRKPLTLSDFLVVM